jgi:peptide/nickel transport system ATP-binding protein
VADAPAATSPPGSAPGGPVVSVEDLEVAFPSSDGDGKVVRGVSFSIAAGERLGLVGESGSGKSMTARAMMQLVPRPGTVSGRVLLDGQDLAGRRKPTEWRGTSLAMITQDPLSSLDPLMRIGRQMTEMLRYHRHLGRAEANARAQELLRAVGIPDPARALTQFPAVLSGGMRQRVALAIAVSCDPRLLIADEPTTALDVTIQAQVLTLLEAMTAEHDSSVLLISHDLGVVAASCARVAVMYAGTVVEEAPTAGLLANPRHPYAQGLIAAVPDIDNPAHKPRGIPGSIPNLLKPPAGCRFHPRCALATEVCRSTKPALRELAPAHRVACHHATP